MHPILLYSRLFIMLMKCPREILDSLRGRLILGWHCIAGRTRRTGHPSTFATCLPRAAMSGAQSVAAVPPPLVQEQPPLEGEPLTDGDEPPIVIAEATSKCRSWPQAVASSLAKGACCGCLRRRRRALWPPFGALGVGLLATPSLATTKLAITSHQPITRHAAKRLHPGSVSPS